MRSSSDNAPKKITEVRASVRELAARYEMSEVELIGELERMRADGLCSFGNIPDNPYTKFRIEMYAPTAPSQAAHRTPTFAEWVEQTYAKRR